MSNSANGAAIQCSANALEDTGNNAPGYTASGSNRPEGTLGEILTHCLRLIRTWSRTRPAVMNTLFVPVALVLIMRLMFSDLIRLASPDHIFNMLPMTLLLVIGSQLMNAVGSSAEIVRERQSGISRRIVTLPTSRIAPMVGRFLFDSLRALLSGIVVLLVSFAVGLRIHTLPSALWIVAVLVGVAFLSAALALLIGTIATGPESTMAVTPLIMIMMFLSAGLMPVDAFVSAVQPIVRISPLTLVVNVGKDLNAGLSISGVELASSIIFCVGGTILLLFLAFATRSRQSRRGDLAG